MLDDVFVQDIFEKKGLRCGRYLTLKQLISECPGQILTVLYLSCILVSSHMLMIFERPFCLINEEEFGRVDSLLRILGSITPFGGTSSSTSTYPGQCVLVFTFVWGILLFSMLVCIV